MNFRSLQIGLFDRIFRKKRKRTRVARPGARRLPNPDSDPDLKAVWLRLREMYFPERQDIDDYCITWGRRAAQKNTLASCNVGRRKVNVARQLAMPGISKWLDAVIYHEMCHAIIGTEVERKKGKRKWHGREFKSLEHRHPDIPDLNLWLKSGGWHRTTAKRKSRS